MRLNFFFSCFCPDGPCHQRWRLVNAWFQILLKCICFLTLGFIKLLSKIKKLEKKFSKLFGMGKRSAEVELLRGFDENVDQVNKCQKNVHLKSLILGIQKLYQSTATAWVTYQCTYNYKLCFWPGNVKEIKTIFKTQYFLFTLSKCLLRRCLVILPMPAPQSSALSVPRDSDDLRRNLRNLEEPSISAVDILANPPANEKNVK